MFGVPDRDGVAAKRNTSLLVKFPDALTKTSFSPLFEPDHLSVVSVPICMDRLGAMITLKLTRAWADFPWVAMLRSAYQIREAGAVTELARVAVAASEC